METLAIVLLAAYAATSLYLAVRSVFFDHLGLVQSALRWKFVLAGFAAAFILFAIFTSGTTLDTLNLAMSAVLFVPFMYALLYAYCWIIRMAWRAISSF